MFCYSGDDYTLLDNAFSNPGFVGGECNLINFILMEQSTIFGEQFETEFLIRRRDLMSVLFKIYLCIGFLIFLVCMVSLIFLFLGRKGEFRIYQLRDPQIMIRIFLGLILLMVGAFISSASLWWEKKWAVQVNLILLGAYFLMQIGNYFYVLYTIGFSLINTVVLFIVALGVPYWILLFRIRHRWEDEAVSKKELEEKGTSIK